MPFILRVDVDKPYGNAGLHRRVMSKLVEDYWFPRLDAFGYLSHLATFLRYCNDQKIQGLFYFRLCTLPNDEIKKLLKLGSHKVGFHAENTRSFETFSDELKIFSTALRHFTVDSFTKHGSGYYKLGKNHYAPYEPEKYKKWAMRAGINYFFGNGIAENEGALKPENTFYPNMFWVEHEYRHVDFSSVEKATELAKEMNVPVLIHPCNYISSENTAKDFHKLVKLSKEKKEAWILG